MVTALRKFAAGVNPYDGDNEWRASWLSSLTVKALMMMREDALPANDGAYAAVQRLASQHGAEAVSLLQSATIEELRQLMMGIGDLSLLPGWIRRELPRCDAAGMWYMDAELAAVLRSIGPEGERIAATIEVNSRTLWEKLTKPKAGNPDLVPPPVLELFRLWDPMTPAINAIAQALWFDRIRPALDRLHHPTMPLDFIGPAVRAYSSPGRRAEGTSIVSPRHGIVATMTTHPAAMLPPRVVATVQRSASVAAHKLLRDIPHRARKIALRDGMDFADWLPVLRIHGGLSAFAEELGIGAKHTARLREALDLFQHVRVIGPQGTVYHGLLTWTERPATRKRRAIVEIVPSKALLIHGAERGKLVPVPRLMPPTIGSGETPAMCAGLQMLVLARMRERGRELVEHGGIQIDGDDWRALMAEVGMPAAKLPDLLGAWTQGARGEPPFLVRDGDRYTLAEAYAEELATLTTGGEWDRSASAAGKRGSAKRWNKRLGKGRKT